MISQKELERLRREGEKRLWYSTRGLREALKGWLTPMMWDFSRFIEELPKEEFLEYSSMKEWVFKWLATIFDERIEIDRVDVIIIGKKRFQSGREIAEWIMQKEKDLIDYILKELHSTYIASML